jgi:hypothetical protein
MTALPETIDCSAAAALRVAGVDRTVGWFRVFLLAHVTFWPLVLWWTRPNPALDLVEMVLWGHEWQLGYTKHPPLPSWIDEAAAVATGHSLWVQFLLPHLAVAIAFWAVWRLGREMVAPRLALLGVCLLECCPFYSAECQELNNNVGLYPCWALAVWLLYRAMKTQRVSFWIGTGVCLGLGMMTKYTTAVLAVTMLGFGVLHPEARRSWRRPGPYLAAAVAILIFLPHVWWAASQGFTTVHYAVLHMHTDHRWQGHLVHPIEFLATQLGVLALPLVVTTVAVGRWRLRPAAASQRFDRTFLVTMAAGPLAWHLGMAMLGNVPLQRMYGTPLWLLAGLLAVACLEIRTEPTRWRRTWIAWLLTVVTVGMILIVGTWATSNVLCQPTRNTFPGRELARRIDELWRARYGESVPIVAGGYFLAGTVAFFLPDTPRVYEGIDTLIDDTAIHDCPWLSDDEFRRGGGVILWNLDVNPEGLARDVLRRFRVAEIVELPPLAYQTRAKVPPARISVAIVPPERAAADGSRHARIPAAGNGNASPQSAAIHSGDQRTSMRVCRRAAASTY